VRDDEPQRLGRPATVTPDAAAEMRRLRALGWSLRDVAAWLDVHYGLAVSHVTVWRHLRN
jgi:transposase